MELLFDPLGSPPIRENILHEDPQALDGVECAGPMELLSILSQYLGLNTETGAAAVRIEQYRKALEKHKEKDPNAFYAASFEADPVSVAKTLLAWRDELVLAKWDFSIEDGMPVRLRSIAEVENRLREESTNEKLEKGVADLWLQVEKQLRKKEALPLRSIHCLMPEEHTPPFFKRLLSLLEAKGIELSYRSRNHEVVASEESDLGRFQRFLVARDQETAVSDPVQYQGDGSLVLLRGDTDRELAQHLARAMKEEERFRPVLLRGAADPDTLSQELTRNGSPGLGEEMDLAGAPIPQLFFLSVQLIWDPLDPERLMEFLTMPRAPLPKRLRYRLAEVLSEKPGRASEDWNKTVEEFLQEWEEEYGPEEREKLQKKIDRWLHHELCDEEKGVSVKQFHERMNALRSWVHGVLKVKKEEGVKDEDPDAGSDGSSMEEAEQDQEGLDLLVASIDRLEESLKSQDPDQNLDRNHLERLTDEVYQEAIREWEPARVGSLVQLDQAQGLKGSVEDQLWWGFVRDPARSSVRSDPWRSEEKNFFCRKGLELDSMEMEIEREEWCMKKGIFNAKKKLVLAIPDKIKGEQMHEHFLLGDLNASTCNLDPLFHSPDELSQALQKAPLKKELREPFHLPTVPAYWEFERTDLFEERKRESFTSLSDLFYFPYKWLLSRVAQIKGGDSFQPPDLRMLYGNLAHRLAEWLFTDHPDPAELDDRSIDAYIDEQLPELLKKEGCTLLLHGFRGQKTFFVQQLRDALKGLRTVLLEGGWKVKGMEEELDNASFEGAGVKAFIDVLLQNDEGKTAFLDLKWSNPANKLSELQNEEELQLAFYADILDQKGYGSPSSGYFLLNSSQLFSRYRKDFPSTEFSGELYDAEGEEVPRAILQRMKASYRFRIEEIRQGRIEVADGLKKELLLSGERMDGEDLLDFPSGKNKQVKQKAPFNDYEDLLEVH